MQQLIFWAISALCLKATSALSGNRFRCSWVAAICAGGWVLLLYLFLMNQVFSSSPPFSYLFLLASAILPGAIPMFFASVINQKSFSMASKDIFRCSSIYMGCMLAAGALYLLINFWALLLLGWANASGAFFAKPYRNF